VEGTVELLRRADASRSLPRLGGMARPNGVVIVSEHHWAFACVDGSLIEGRMPQPPEVLQRLPLARGLVRLWASLAPVFRRSGVAPSPERWLVISAVLAPVGLALVGGPWSTIAGVLLSVALLATILRGRALHLHGAEHRAIAALEERRLRETWTGLARPSRFSLRCGTNFAALLLPVAIFGGRFWPLPATAVTPLVVSVLALALTMELWQLVQRLPRLARVVLLPGLALQRLTTREPELAETRVALTALAAVLRRELAHG